MSQIKWSIALLGVCLLAYPAKMKAQKSADNNSTDTSYHAIPLENLDRSVKPTDNFYQFAVGNWIKRNPVPASKSAWFSFNELYENNRKILHELLIDAAKAGAPKGSNTQKLGDFFKAGMDSLKREADGYTPLKPYLEEINAIKNLSQLAKTTSKFMHLGLGDAYGFGVNPDDKNSNVYILNFNQAGLGLPDRDYYLKNDEKSKMIQLEYQKYIQKMFQLIGYTEAQAKIATTQVYEIEKSMAVNSFDRVKLRDPYANYHKTSFKDFSKTYPNSMWVTQVENFSLNPQKVDSINVGQPIFFKGLDSLYKNTPIANWKNYLKWKLVASSAGSLSTAFEKESFAFNGTILSGTKVMEKRWEKLSSLLNIYLGEALGEEYVKKAFPPEAKVRMLSLVNNLRVAFAERIKALDWMTDSTKQKALGKLNAITVKIGYPDKWIDYSSVEVSSDHYFQDVLNARLFANNFEISHYGKPVDKTEWGMTPPTVNAYYNPSFNEIVFPAGILQPPFFDFKADDAVNYGGIGAVIGHEITHGFDDQGRLYDAEGNLKSWWSKTDEEQFKIRAGKVVKQFNEYTVLDTIHVNGELTEGENLADLGGTMIAYQAFKKTPQGNSNTTIDGFTPDQRFFLSFAQVWRGNILPQASALRIVTDPHSPGKWRTIGPLSNNVIFYKAFGVKEGDKMFRPENVRAKIW